LVTGSRIEDSETEQRQQKTSKQQYLVLLDLVVFFMQNNK